MSKAPTFTAASRRLDWRFLLPVSPSHVFDKAVLIGADPEVVDAFVSTGIARVVSTTLGDRDADLVAVCCPAVTRPEEVVKATREGGLIYIEVDRRRSGTRALTPRRLATALDAAGATVTAQYALRPAPERCELYVPLDRSGALQWFLSSEYIPSSPLKRAATATLRRLAGVDTARLGALAPFHATIALASMRRPAAVGGEHSMAMIVHGGQRAVQIAFCAQSPGSPAFVTKIPTVASAAQRTLREHTMMSRIRAAVGPPDNDALPSPRPLLESSAGPILVEDGAPGRSLAHMCGRWGGSEREKAEDLRLATSWLIRLHRDHAIRERPWDHERHVAWVERPLEAFASRFVITDEEAELFDAVRTASADLIGRPLADVWEHGDYTIWNIFRDGDRIRVLDWEHARAGIPLLDVIRLATHWHEVVRGLETPSSRWKGFADLFTGSTRNPAAKEALTAVLRYEEALGIDPGFRSVFLVVSRVELAVRRLEHQVEVGIIDDDVRAGNNAVGYLSALVERRNDLFPLPS